MKFDVVIANPPYHLNDNGNGVSARPIYHLFVSLGKKLNPHYLSMIIPARWYAGGKGLTKFREEMLNDQRMKILVDYERTVECFDNVNIAGGICYFLWDKSHSGPCSITNAFDQKKTTMERYLNEFPVLVRSNKTISIVRKIINSGMYSYSNYIYPRNLFGFQTNFKGRQRKETGDVEILTSSGFQYTKRSTVKKNNRLIDTYKVLIGRLVTRNGEVETKPEDGYKIITNPIIGPNQINIETYMNVDVFNTLQEAENFKNFLCCKFTRFLLKQGISSLNISTSSFYFVPYEDSKQSWSDEKLYKKYKLNQEEINFIESIIKPMN